jgi:hypothetical protein
MLYIKKTICECCGEVPVIDTCEQTISCGCGKRKILKNYPKTQTFENEYIVLMLPCHC